MLWIVDAKGHPVASHEGVPNLTLGPCPYCTLVVELRSGLKAPPRPSLRHLGRCSGLAAVSER